jgi:hypothetical protein
MKTGSTKLDKDTTKEKYYRLSSLMNRVPKAPKKMLTNKIQKHIKKIIHLQVKFMPGSQRFLNTYKQINVNQHINRTKNKNHMIISIGADKIFENIQHHFMITNAPAHLCLLQPYSQYLYYGNNQDALLLMKGLRNPGTYI